jgi:hypothetical protein
MKKNDILLIAIIIVISLAALLVYNILGKAEQLKAVIVHDNQLIERIDLSKVE